MALDGEIWKDVVGYEGLYMVSSKGRLRSLISNKILKPNLQKTGYESVALHKNKRQISYRLHRLIALSFIGNPNNYPIINHINSIKNDNRVINLEWCTQSQNNYHGYKYGNMKAPNSNKGRFGKESFSSRTIDIYDINGTFIERVKGMAGYERLNNIPKGTIKERVRLKKSYRGLTFKKANDVRW